MPHFQSPTLFTSPRILFDCAIWHLQHQHDCYHCRKQRQSLCRVLGQTHCGFVNVVCPPRRRQLLRISQLGSHSFDLCLCWPVFVSTVTQVSITLICHIKSHYSSEKGFASQVIGGGTPQRDSSQSANQSELSCFSERSTDLTNC